MLLVTDKSEPATQLNSIRKHGGKRLRTAEPIGTDGSSGSSHITLPRPPLGQDWLQDMSSLRMKLRYDLAKVAFFYFIRQSAKPGCKRSTYVKLALTGSLAGLPPIRIKLAEHLQGARVLMMLVAECSQLSTAL